VEVNNNQGNQSNPNNNQYNYNNGYNNPYVNNDTYNQSFEIKATISRKDAETYVRWGKILGIIIIIMGAFACLSCFGAIIGVPYILSGLKFHRSAQSLERSLLIGDETSVQAAFHDIAGGTKIMGIMLLVYIIISVVMMIAMIALMPIFVELMENSMNYDYSGMNF
jgi:hypothetical protein